MTAMTAPGLGHRLATLLLLLVVGSGFYLLVDRVLVAQYHHYQTLLEQQQGRLIQLERMTATQEPIQQLIARIQQDRNITAQYLPQSAPALAAADLQQRLKAVVESAGGTLQSIQSLPPAEEGGTVKVAVSVTATGDTAMLQKVLYELETQTPLLFVDNLDVTARETRPRLSNGRVAPYTRVQLYVQLEVSGYLRRGDR